ncbi:MAG: hypothetical protein LBB94_02155 [Clostridiales bacterium]|jgi:hypothetical protein|nr:hypothetical protein [Clostridiales bacterium]
MQDGGRMSLIAGWKPRQATLHLILGCKYMGAFLLKGITELKHEKKDWN